MVFTNVYLFFSRALPLDQKLREYNNKNLKLTKCLTQIQFSFK